MARPERDAPALKRKIWKRLKTHVPDGSERLPGPLRALYLNMTFPATLQDALNPYGRGGLPGRFGPKVAEHLAELDSLRERGEEHDAVILWDFESMHLRRKFLRDPRLSMNRFLRLFAGMLNLTVTRCEAVEVTPFGRTHEGAYTSGELSWYIALRQVGGVVHRVWPLMTDSAVKVLIERFRALLDDMKNGGRKRTIVLFSGDEEAADDAADAKWDHEGFQPMLDAAQSEGVTVIHFRDGQARYYPGGLDFSVPIQIPTWQKLRHDLRSWDLDPLRPDEEWLPEHGPRTYVDGNVALEVYAPEEELDRRVFHEWMPKHLNVPPENKFEGRWVRRGIRLNATLEQALQSALNRTGTEGTRRGRLKPQVRLALEKDMQALKLAQGQDTAAVFWNWEDFRLMPKGPTQREMLARIVRYFKGYLGMPISRMEVSQFVEPWEKLGAHPMDWLYQMQNLGMVVHRVWPPKEEMVNRALTRSVGVLGKTSEAINGGAEFEDAKPPRLICILSDEMYFDDNIRLAQAAGISTVVIQKAPPGKDFTESRGVYYPANSDVTVRIDTLDWMTVTDELSQALNDPFMENVATPDAPAAAARVPQVPPDMHWGCPDELDLDSSKVQPVYLDA